MSNESRTEMFYDLHYFEIFSKKDEWKILFLTLLSYYDQKSAKTYDNKTTQPLRAIKSLGFALTSVTS